MMISLISLALASTGASAQFFGGGRDRFGGRLHKPTPVPLTPPPLSRPPPPPPPPPPTSFVQEGPNNGQVTKIGVSTECAADALAISFTDFTDVFVEASASAVAAVCQSDIGPSYDPTSPQFATALAQAYAGFKNVAVTFANAFAGAAAGCVSVSNAGKTQGCSYAKADASAFTFAFIEAYSSAVADAFALYCSCGSAEAWTAGEASLFIEVFSQAEAAASAFACSSGNQLSFAEAFADCFATTFATVFAKAVAEATASADCFVDGGDAVATANILAEVGADIFEYEACYVGSQAVGDAGGFFSGSSGNFVFPTSRFRQ